MRQRIYFTEEDLQKKSKKQHLKHKGYFRVYYKYYYLKKRIEELEKSPKDKAEKFDEILLLIRNKRGRGSRKG
ncbi:MAG: hypothetical protein NY202_01900 [Mollicutes bacterium UO1]